MSTEQSSSFLDDAAISPVWTGQHIFTQPLVFSPKQVFPASQILVPDQRNGDILCVQNSIWKKISAGAPGMVLTVQNTMPAWGKLDLSVAAAGTLPVLLGGTGKSLYDIGDILFSPAQNSLDALPIGNMGEFLCVGEKGTPSWKPIRSLQGKGEPLHLACWDETGNHLSSSGFVLSPEGAVLHAPSLEFQNASGSFGLLSRSQGAGIEIWVRQKDQETGAKLRMGGTDAALFSLSLQNSVLWSINKEGQLDCGIVPSSRIKGILDASRGGTGNGAYTPGDILYAVNSTTLARLSSRDCEGRFLQVVRGMPAWSDAAFSTPATSEKALPSLESAGGEIKCEDGEKLYFTSSKNGKKEIAFTNSDITGKSAGISGTLSLEQGGLGADLSKEAVAGALVCLSGPTRAACLSSGEEGQTLLSRGKNKIPVWEAVVRNVDGNFSRGIEVTGGTSSPIVSIYSGPKFEPEWKGVHKFSAGVNLEDKAVLKLGTAGVSFQPAAPEDVPGEGRLFFDGSSLCFRCAGQTARLSSGQNGSAACKQSSLLSFGPRVRPVPNQIDTEFALAMPFSFEDGITPVVWRVLRMDWRAEKAPVGGYASLQILTPDGALGGSDFHMDAGAQQVSRTDFSQTILTSGDLLRLHFGEVSESDFWSIHLLIQSA